MLNADMGILHSALVCKGSIASWEPLDSQPEEGRVLILSKDNATMKRHHNFKKRVSYFMNAPDTTLVKLALFEYQGKQPTETAHGNAQANTLCTRTHPKTLKNQRKGAL